tara:strand:+ start:602 stop:1771 length:1170 start_codon:yes stop_codon:yes gene_type:complete
MGVLNMKIFNYFFVIIALFTIPSCDFNDPDAKYDEQLVIFASITANLPVLENILVSRTASIAEDIISDSLWIDDARVELIHIINDSTQESLSFKNIGKGEYTAFDTSSFTNDEFIAWSNFIIKPGETYMISVIHDQDSLIATTTVPDSLIISSAELGDYSCPDGELIPTKVIDANNLDNFSFDELGPLFSDPEGFITGNNINVDTLVYRFGDCFTRSFASYPFFGIDFDSDNFQTIKILSYGLEANERGLEPLDTLSEVIDTLTGLGFYDYNQNGFRDSVFVNLIYDTTLGFRIWKGQYLRDDNNTPYRINPWPWNIESSPSQIMWLYFDYYGYNLMTFQATSESYFNYFSGDPVGQNIYLLPKSNFEGGLGVFYSNNSASFVVYVEPE